jgi:hypothetical protein
MLYKKNHELYEIVQNNALKLTHGHRRDFFGLSQCMEHEMFPGGMLCNCLCICGHRSVIFHTVQHIYLYLEQYLQEVWIKYV